jgi:hypothetical protein
MSIAFSILSKLCFAWIVVYVVFSLRSAMWAGARHSRGLLLLEFQSHRARGPRETARARLLKRMALLAILALPAGVASLIASAALS